MLEYLGRYTHRVAISNERIVGIDEGQVAFRVRADPGSGKKRTMHLPGPAFIDRFFLRVLPKGFKPTDGTLASLANCALDLGPDELADSTYVKRLRQRERNGGK